MRRQSENSLNRPLMSKFGHARDRASRLLCMRGARHGDQDRAGAGRRGARGHKCASRRSSLRRIQSDCVVERAVPVFSVAAVRANQLPRLVIRATALLPDPLICSIPSRLRSATVTPNIGLSLLPAQGDFHTPRDLWSVPSPLMQAMRAPRLAAESSSMGARASSGVACRECSGRITAWSA